MTHKIEISTASVAGAAAASPVWLAEAEHALSVTANPFWAEMLAPLGVLWLVIQISFYLFEKWKQYRGDNHGDN